MSWLAFRSEDTDGVAAAINLLNPSLTNWETGIDAAYTSGKVYVSPPVKGWVFAVGNPCSYLDDDTNKNIEKLKNWLRALSSQFGEVQAFATHRVTEYQKFWTTMVQKPLTSRCLTWKESMIFVRRMRTR